MEENDNIIVEMFITTYDNPFDPFTDFNQWNSYDIQLGYNTCALIDRVYQAFSDSNNSNENDENQNDAERVESMKRIVSLMPNVYKLIKHETFVESIPLSSYDIDTDQ